MNNGGSDCCCCYLSFIESFPSLDVNQSVLCTFFPSKCTSNSDLMAQQEDGWPLGLQPLNARAGLVRNHEYGGSVSFNTLLTGSPSSSTLSSSDLDTESTGSFFHDKSITLGSLIGISNILELSRSTGGRGAADTLKDKKNDKCKSWFFSLCSRLSTDAVNMKNTNSLGHFLEAERRAASYYSRNRSPTIYGPDDFSQVQPVSDTNSLFVGGEVAPPHPPPPPPQSNAWLASDSNGNGVPLLFSCLCGQLSH